MNDLMQHEDRRTEPRQSFLDDSDRPLDTRTEPARLYQKYSERSHSSNPFKRSPASADQFLGSRASVRANAYEVWKSVRILAAVRTALRRRR